MPTDQVIGLKEFSSVLIQIVIASFIVERALALLFEWDIWNFLVKKAPWLAGGKEVIAFLVSYTICVTAKFDALKVLFKSEMTDIGQIITAMVIAGGSKGAIKLMQDVWKIKSVSQENTQNAITSLQGSAEPTPVIQSLQNSLSKPIGAREGQL